MSEFVGEWRALRPPAQVIARYRTSGWWRDRTYVDDLAAVAREAPDEVAIVNWRGECTTDVTLTFGELWTYTRRFAGGLRALGVGQGDVVAFHLPGWWEASALTFACALVGAIAAPSPMWFGPAALARLWPNIEPVVCVTPDQWKGVEHAQALAGLADHLPSLKHRVVVGDAQATGALDFQAHFIRTPWEQAEAAGFPGIDADQVAMVLFTSGTTGCGQAVLHTANTLYAGVRGSLLAWPPETGRRVLGVPSPITHIGGILHAILGPVIGRYTAVAPDDIHTDQLHDLCVRHGVTQLIASPPRLGALATAANAAARKAETLRTIVNIGAQLPAAVAASLRASLDVCVLNEWGCTQTCGGTMTSPADPPDWAAHSIGRPIPGAEIRLSFAGGLSADSAELHVRGPAVCVGVFGCDGSVIGADGWHRTGDLVRPDGRGGLTYRGRGEHLVGAPYLPLIELEDSLRAHPAIHDIALVDLPDSHLGTILCAVVVPEPGAPRLTLDDLRAEFHKLGLAEDTHPVRLEFVATLPRDDLGKLQRRALAASLTASAFSRSL